MVPISAMYKPLQLIEPINTDHAMYFEEVSQSFFEKLSR